MGTEKWHLEAAPQRETETLIMAAQEWAASRHRVMAETDGGSDVNLGCRKHCQALEMISRFVGGSLELVGRWCTTLGPREWEGI